MSEKSSLGKDREELDIIRKREKYWNEKFEKLNVELLELKTSLENNKRKSVVPPRTVKKVRTIGLQVSPPKCIHISKSTQTVN